MWTIDEIIKQLNDTYNKGYIGLAQGQTRKDNGVIGQVLEREFGVVENNINAPDLGQIELKAKRTDKKGKLTLFHQTTETGSSPNEIFDTYGYYKKSNRSDQEMKKLFTTISHKENNRGFRILYNQETSFIDLYNANKLIAGWGAELNSGWNKIQNMLVVIADTEGAPMSNNERFNYRKALLCTGLKPLAQAIRDKDFVIEFCIDQPIGSSKVPHDRGPHFRTTIPRLKMLYKSVEIIFDR